jgi:hypothetical protein
MLRLLQAHWRRLSTGVLALTLLGAGSVQLYHSVRGDCCSPGSPCCYPGSPCCYPGSPCCHGHGSK